MPSIVPLLDKVTIISARSTYEKALGNFPALWKKSCFLDCIHKTFVDSGSKNILGVGDSQAEREAIRECRKEVPDALVKCIKLVERPTPSHLQMELELMVKTFSHFCSYQAELDLSLQLNPQLSS